MPWVQGALKACTGSGHELGWRGSDAKGPEGLLRHAQGVSSSQASTECTYVGLRTLWHSEGAASCLLVPSPGRVLTEPCPRPRVRALGVCKWVLCWYRSKGLITAKLPGAHMIAGGSQLCPFSCRHPRLSLLADTGAYQDYKDPGPSPQLEAFGRASPHPRPVGWHLWEALPREPAPTALPQGLLAGDLRWSIFPPRPLAARIELRLAAPKMVGICVFQLNRLSQLSQDLPHSPEFQEARLRS